MALVRLGDAALTALPEAVATPRYDHAALGAHDAWPVVAQPFFDWAVEDRFAAGRPDWSAGGARFVEQTAPGFAPVLGELAGDERLVAALAPPLRSLRERDVLATLEAMQ